MSTLSLTPFSGTDRDDTAAAHVAAFLTDLGASGLDTFMASFETELETADEYEAADIRSIREDELRAIINAYGYNFGVHPSGTLTIDPIA